MRLATFISAALIVSMTSIAEACRCRQPPPPKSALAQSAAVFAGKVTAVEADGPNVKVTLQISRTWKGTTGKTVTIRTNASSASCGVTFKKGTAYLVYCPKSDGTKAAPLTTNLCTRTKELATAAVDLKELGRGKKP